MISFERHNSNETKANQRKYTSRNAALRMEILKLYIFCRQLLRKQLLQMIILFNYLNWIHTILSLFKGSPQNLSKNIYNKTILKLNKLIIYFHFIVLFLHYTNSIQFLPFNVEPIQLLSISNFSECTAKIRRCGQRQWLTPNRTDRRVNKQTKNN